MTPPKISIPLIVAKSFLFCSIVLLIGFHAITIRADSTDGTTPLALQPGTPAGSYALSDLDNTNPYNGSLNFRLPLLNIGGRGTAAYTMTLPIEQKWRINVLATYLILYEDGGGPPLPEPQVTYHYFPSANWWAGIKPGYGPGVLQGRVAQFDSQVCPDSTMRAAMTLTRLTFTAPDGTEFELRDKQTDGTPAGVGICDANGLNRGRIFVTADGSAATFVSDQNIVDYIWVPNAGNDIIYPSGYLLLREGTRYRIDNGTVSWLRDRNGNKMTFTYDSFKRMTIAKDSLHREVTVAYSTASVAYDEISYKGFAGASRTIRVNYAYLQDAGSLGSGYSIQTYYQLFPMVGSSGSGTYNPKIIRSVTLPNNQQYQFQYNSYGELARVVLPTGGAFEYDHAGGFGGGDASGVVGGAEGPNVYRRVITRRVYDNGTTMSNKTTFSGQNAISGNTNYVLIDQFGSDGSTRLHQKKIHYEGYAENSFLLLPTDYSPWKDGREFQSDSVAADGTTVLQRIAHTWQQPTAGGSWPLTQPETNASAKPNNAQVTQVVTTLEPMQANKVSKQTFAFDKYTNRTDVYEYQFGTGAAGSLVRRTRTDYLLSGYDTLNPSSSNPDLNLTSHIRNLPAQISLFDSGGVERARSTTEYDNYVLDGPNCSQSFHCPLLSRSNISGFDSSFTASYTMRGNPTAVTRYLMSNGAVTASVSAYSHYDVAGNVLRSIDPRSTPSNIIATTIEYDDRFGTPNNEARSNTVPSELSGFTSFGFATKVINAFGHTAYAQFDYYLGKPVNGEDANGIVASGSCSDVLDRPTQIRRGIGTSAENQTTFAYDDAARIVTSTSDLHANNDNILVSKVFYDQMGRTIETRQYEGGSNFIAAQTQYDALGRPFKTSNPFRPWQSESAVWTTQAFDALGRVTSVTTPDNAVVSTSYGGNSVTATDQIGKKRKSVTDALGRLIEVYEDPEIPGGPTELNYQTSYTYDVLDNLVKVTQGSQQRFFMYDSLKRLIRARNPEQSTYGSLALSDPITGNSAWSIGYQYDANSNLTVKTDVRGTVSTYVYDALNRNTTIDYSNTAGINPDLTRVYDTATNGKGRLRESYAGGTEGAGANVEHTRVVSYDALGRPLDQRQRFKTNSVWSAEFQTQRGYNRAGAVIAQTYPSGRTVNYGYDNAGRLLSFSGTLGDGANRNYATEVLYSPFGGMAKEKFGTDTPLYNKAFYNNRGQLSEIRVGTTYTGPTDTGWQRGALINHYSSQCWGVCSGTDNNGNLKQQDHWIPDSSGGVQGLFVQTYSYDSLNRLQRVVEGSSWQQEFVYDRWGNRTIHQSNTWGVGINKKEFTVDAATNRLGVPGGQFGTMTYDAAGNLTTDTYTGAGNREYDAENRMTRAWGGNNQWQEYSYNADGQRTRRKVDSVETRQVYGMEGELLAEYAATAAPATPQKEYGYRNGQLLVTAESVTSVNVALAASGGTATASSTLSPYLAQYVIDGSRRATNNDVWLDNTYNSFPDWIEVSFNGSKTITEIDVITQQDAYPNTVEPTLTQSFSLYGITAFEVQYWNGSTWATVPGGSVTANNKVWRQFSFAPITTTKIRVAVNAGADNAFSRVVEVEAWTAGSSARVNWLVTDQLGTPRMIIDQTGMLANIKRHDYLPFGEELYSGVGGRSVALGYGGSDGVRQQFTQKERDIETNLDFFEARYYSAIQGRFTSVDPGGAGADQGDPRSWNAYAYAGGNPILFSDPDGREYLVCGPNGNDGKCTTVSDEEFWAERKELKKTGNTYTGSGDFFETGQIKNADGEVVATYAQISIDDRAQQYIFAIRGAVDPIPKATAQFFGISVVLGTGGGVLYYALAPVLAPTVTTLGLRAAPLLPAVPSAIEKLQKVGISLERANAIIQSPASQKLIDNANNGNINHVQEVGGKLIRITTDPTGQRIISAGIIRANSITNGIANGRFTPKK